MDAKIHINFYLSSHRFYLLEQNQILSIFALEKKKR